MLHLYETKKAKRIAVVAALVIFATAGVAAARQEGQFPGLPPADGSNTGRVSGSAGMPGSNMSGMQAVLQRAAQYQQAASVRGSTGPSAVRVSYSAANQAFGDLLRTIGTPTAGGGISSGSGQVLNLSSEQAANDVRLLRAAARQAKSTDEGNRLKKAASLYATGAKEFLTAQLREALLEADVAAPVVVRGNAREADAATRAQTQPPRVTPAPAPKPNQPAPAPAPNQPAPAPNQPAPNQPAPNQPDPNPPAPSPNQPAPAPDPNTPPVPSPNTPVPIPPR